MTDEPLGHLSIEGGQAVIRLNLDQVHDLRVALEPCPCKATKSTANRGIRERLAKSLGLLQVMADRRR